MGPCVLRILDCWWQQHQTGDPGSRALGRRLQNARQCARLGAMLGWLVREVDLNEDIKSPAEFGSSLIQPSKQAFIVHRLDDVKVFGGFARLVRLEMPDEMPGRVESREALKFIERFLYAILANVALAGFVRRSNVIRLKCFRDGDEANPGGVASGPAGSARDPFANGFQPGPKRGSVEHYFRVSSAAFAVAASLPFGESFK